MDPYILEQACMDYFYKHHIDGELFDKKYWKKYVTFLEENKTDWDSNYKENLENDNHLEEDEENEDGQNDEENDNYLEIVNKMKNMQHKLAKEKHKNEILKKDMKILTMKNKMLRKHPVQKKSSRKNVESDEEDEDYESDD